VENAGGLGRHLAGRLAAAGESVVDVPPKLSARVRVLSTGNARKNDGVDALAIALAASRNEKACGRRSRRWLGDAKTPFREERGPRGRTNQGVKPPARTLTRPRPRRGGREALGRPGLAHPTLLRPKEGASARLRRRLASEVLREVRTLDRKIADLNERIEAEVEASGTTLT
jgi:transposase